MISQRVGTSNEIMTDGMKDERKVGGGRGRGKMRKEWKKLRNGGNIKEGFGGRGTRGRG